MKLFAVLAGHAKYIWLSSAAVRPTQDNVVTMGILVHVIHGVPNQTSSSPVIVRKEPFEEVGRLAYAARGQASAAYAV
ncbi:hypothetical protein T265_01483 [Opisthorchis viverrini]|uniref:Uncharacterized protein n=1 Tax=Opisthorchis viverrini TaxID=6198 RepID=A0A074ZY92_OPIVI|nr:hypothetical protein T265_01483 [Opisthorchis viverrini]KER32428.1 hypothetical protein T265_01483 [Opisthorchis viverrini]